MSDRGDVAKTNSSMGSARKAKKDEFYTQWVDVEREMNAYLEYDPDVFRGKTILLPCDDPEWSNFTKFFALHYVEYGIKKIISTSYAPNSNAGGAFYNPTLFEMNADGYDPVKSMERGRVFVLDSNDITGDGRIDIDDLQWEYLEGDGDFRSAEVTELRNQSDMVITNPPFSLFREFMGWLSDGGVQFSVIGNSNAITYKEIFPLIQHNRVWLGATRDGTGSMWFRVADSAPNKTGQRVDENGIRYQTIGSSAWFTNIEHGRRHEPLALMTEADNVKYSRHKHIRDFGYLAYDNYDAIEVPRVEAIPSDYKGIMGVPITFLGKYNPDQFEVVGFADRANSSGLRTRVYTKSDSAKYNDLNRTCAYQLPDGTIKGTFDRIFIRHRALS